MGIATKRVGVMVPMHWHGDPIALARFSTRRVYLHEPSWSAIQAARGDRLTIFAKVAKYRKVASGRYENASEVERASLRALEREEQGYEIKLAKLRGALEEGEASGDAEDYSLDGLIAELDGETTKARAVPHS